MKTLYLIRHAKSSWKNPILEDFDRPLSKRGKRDAPFMGQKLAEMRIKADLILSSPAKRAKKTAFEIASKIGYSKSKIKFIKELYEASGTELIKIIKKVDDKYDSVIIFGHNPGFTMLNNILSNYYIDNIPTCGIVALQLDQQWKDIDKNFLKLMFFEQPKNYFE